MSTEPKPATGSAPPAAPASPVAPSAPAAPSHNQAKPEPTALAVGLQTGWAKFKRGELLSYKWMAIILLLVAGTGTTWWILSQRSKDRSAKWTEWDGLASPTALKKFADENPNTYQARLARLEIARMNLGQLGIRQMYSPTLSAASSDAEIKQFRDARAEAVENVEKAREEFTKLVDEFKSDPVIRVQCLMGVAQAETALVGIPKAGQLLERRGNPAKAIEWLDKVTEAAPETHWGKDAKKLADALRNQNTQEQIATLQTTLYDLSPDLKKWDPRVPKDRDHGWPGP